MFNKRENQEPHSFMDAFDEVALSSIFDKVFEEEDAEKAETIRRSYENYEKMQQQAQELFNTSMGAPVPAFMPAQYGVNSNQPLVGVSSIIGRRSSQQDAVAITDMVYGSFPQEKWMAILSDGMGGMNGGELASSTCVNQFINAFNQNIKIFLSFSETKLMQLMRLFMIYQMKMVKN